MPVSMRCSTEPIQSCLAPCPYPSSPPLQTFIDHVSSGFMPSAGTSVAAKLLGTRTQQPRCEIAFHPANADPFYLFIKGYDDGYPNEGRQAAFNLCMLYLKPTTSFRGHPKSAHRIHFRLYLKDGSDCLMIGLRLERIDEHGYFEANVGVAACQAMTIAATPLTANLLASDTKDVSVVTQPVGWRRPAHKMPVGRSDRTIHDPYTTSGPVLPQRAIAADPASGQHASYTPNVPSTARPNRSLGFPGAALAQNGHNPTPGSRKRRR